MVAVLTSFAKEISKREKHTTVAGARSGQPSIILSFSIERKEKKKKSLRFPAIITGAS